MALENFDAVAVRDILVAKLKKMKEEQGVQRVVLGVSGGKDSTVCAALCARAFGAENVYGIMLPDNVQSDISDSMKVCDSLGIPRRVINIGEIHKALLGAVENAENLEVPYHRESDINVGPRLRMTVLRYITQAIGGRLCGTGNLSESFVGYCTKDGDTSCDFALLAELTSVEVVEVGKTMEELPKELVVKTPSDGLSGKSDEERMGVSYMSIHKYIREGSSGNPDDDAIIERMHKASAHKRSMPPKITVSSD